MTTLYLRWLAVLYAYVVLGNLLLNLLLGAE